MPRHITMRDIDAIDAELESVAALRHAARRQGRPLPTIDVADALLDERLELTDCASIVGIIASGRRESA
jgi:hypothetical protein